MTVVFSNVQSDYLPRLNNFMRVDDLSDSLIKKNFGKAQKYVKIRKRSTYFKQAISRRELAALPTIRIFRSTNQLNGFQGDNSWAT